MSYTLYEIEFKKDLKPIENIQDLENRIKYAMTIKDEHKRQEEIKKIVIAIKYSSIKSSFRENRDMICNMQIDVADKLRFLMMAANISYKEMISIEGTLDFFYLCFNNCTKDFVGFKEDVLELIKKDLDLQKEYTTYFKLVDYRNVELREEMEALLALPMFREFVLTDEEFISDYFRDNDNFYLSLPNEYGYLIAYTAPDYYSLCELLYSKYFGQQLDSDQIEELIDLQIEIYDEENPFNISMKYKLQKLVFVLKTIATDSNFFDNLKRIQRNVNLSFSEAVDFVCKYYDTELYGELIKDDVIINEDIREKLKYLANSPKKKYIETLTNLGYLTLEDLEDLDEEIDNAARINIGRGPNSKTSNSFYPDSAEKEVRRIDRNGRTDIKSSKDTRNNSNDHIDILKSTYDGEISCKSNLSQDIAAEAVEKLGSITELIENEKCYIFISEDPSLAQKKKCIDWLRSGRGNVGIFVYYDKLKCFIPMTGKLIDVGPTIKYILRMGDRITEEELEKVQIPDFKEEKKELDGGDR